MENIPIILKCTYTTYNNQTNKQKRKTVRETTYDNGL